MDLNDLRVAALNQAAIDEKHAGGSGVAYLLAPTPTAVVTRAATYLSFLTGERRPVEAKQLLTTERENELLHAINAKDVAPPYYNLRNILRIAIAEGAASVVPPHG